MPAARRAAELLQRERLMGQLVLAELRRAAPVRLGISLPKDKRLRALCEAVLAEPTRHASLEGWAGEAGASARTVARLFRQQLGTSFGPWRQQVLLAHALTLAARGKPMGVIASRSRLRQRERLHGDGAALGGAAAGPILRRGEPLRRAHADATLTSTPNLGWR